MIDFDEGRPAPGNLDVTWHAGWPSARHDPRPPIQVHDYQQHTIIMRQNKSVHYEAPFLFLLFGNDRALLIDTGATAEAEFFPLRQLVDSLITRWLGRHPLPGYSLLVAHTHGHRDHVAGDAQFAGRPRTTIVQPGREEVVAFYDFHDWPATSRPLDLGGPGDRRDSRARS